MVWFMAIYSTVIHYSQSKDGINSIFISPQVTLKTGVKLNLNCLFQECI